MRHPARVRPHPTLTGIHRPLRRPGCRIPRRTPGDHFCPARLARQDGARRRHDAAEESITAWALAARGGDPEAVERFVRALHRDVRHYVTYLERPPGRGRPRPGDVLARTRQPAPFRGPLLRPHLAALHRPPRGDRQLAPRRRPAPASPTPTTGSAPPNGPNRRGLPASTTAWRSPNCWPSCPRTGVRRSSSPNSSDCPTRRRHTSATARSAPYGPGSPTPRTSLVVVAAGRGTPGAGRGGGLTHRETAARRWRRVSSHCLGAPRFRCHGGCPPSSLTSTDRAGHGGDRPPRERGQPSTSVAGRRPLQVRGRRGDGSGREDGGRPPAYAGRGAAVRVTMHVGRAPPWTIIR